MRFQFILWVAIVFAVGTACDEGDVVNNYPPTAPGDTTACDTTATPCVTDTFYIYIQVPPDTVYILPDLECFEECTKENGLAHWRTCIGACLEAHGP